MKKLVLIAALAASFSAFAGSESSSQASYGAGLAGIATGTVSSTTEGQSVTAAQVNGYGSSNQVATGSANGNATASIAPGAGSITVNTNVNHGATSFAQGSVSGNAPITVGNAIANGAASFDQASVNADITAHFVAGELSLVGFQQATVSGPGHN